MESSHWFKLCPIGYENFDWFSMDHYEKSWNLEVEEFSLVQVLSNKVRDLSLVKFGPIRNTSYYLQVGEFSLVQVLSNRVRVFSLATFEPIRKEFKVGR